MLVIHDGEKRDEDLIEARGKRSIDERVVHRNPREVCKAVREELVAERPSFAFLTIREIDRDVGPEWSLAHLFGDEPALERSVLEGPPHGDDLGAVHVKGGGIELLLVVDHRSEDWEVADV